MTILEGVLTSYLVLAKGEKDVYVVTTPTAHRIAFAVAVENEVIYTWEFETGTMVAWPSVEDMFEGCGDPGVEAYPDNPSLTYEMWYTLAKFFRDRAATTPI